MIKTHRQKLLSHSILLAKAALAMTLLSTQLAQADSVGQVQTTKYFAPETVAMILQRVQDVANGVPGATLGFKSGDTLSYIIQFTPISNGGGIGAGGYITDYIPAGTQVTNAQFVQPDGAGNFYQVAPPAPAQMDDGIGNIGGGYTSNWTTDPYTITTCAQAGQTLATCMGSLSQLYADTGIFYSTDARTAVLADPSTDGRIKQWSAPTGNGYNVCPFRGMSQLVSIMGGLVTTCAAGGASTHNSWDAAMTSAYGTTSANIATLAGLPRISGNPQVTVTQNGTGVTPFNSGSPVAGPNTGYQLDYTGNVGPWQRISYPGSMVGSNAYSATNPATVSVPNDIVVATPTGAGASFPLPASTTAVRWAAGRLVTGSQSFVKISLQLTTSPPAAGLINNSEVFGGDESPEAGGGDRDNPWVYHVPSVATNVSTMYILKSIVCVYDATGTCIANSGADLPATVGALGPKVRYRIVYLNTNNGTEHNITICDQLPDMSKQTPTTQIAFTSVTQITNNPNIGAPSSPAVAGCNLTGLGTTFSYPTIAALAGGGAGVLEYEVQFPVLTAATVVTNQAKAISTEIPDGVTSYAPSNVLATLGAAVSIIKTASTNSPNRGDTISYTITIDNKGGTVASIATLVDNLPGFATGTAGWQAPSRVNYVSTPTITINGTALSGVAILDVPPAAPATTNSETVTWTFPSGTKIPAGGQMVVTFTATMGDNTANNHLAYVTAYTNTATITCPNCTTTAVAATNTAPVTITAPTLNLFKTIDCVFSGATCTAGSYVTGSSIPALAKLRYKIYYTNPEVSAQTITLSDTLPASATAAGNLYVASGPDIRPSAPVLSVNPAAAGAARGADAALTAIAGSSVVNFTAASLPANSTGVVYMDVQTNVAAGTTVTNAASIQSTQRAAAAGAAVTNSVSAIAASLTLTKTASPTTIASTGTTSYTVSVTNNTGAGVVITNIIDTLPLPTAGTIQCGTSSATCLAVSTMKLNGVTITPTGTWTAAGAAGQTMTWTLPGTAAARTLNNNASLVLTFTATYTGVPGNTTYLNNATLNYTGGSAIINGAAPVYVPYNTLSIAKAVTVPASSSIAPNSAVTYQITVTNTGAYAVPVTRVVDTLPASPTGTVAYTSTTSVVVASGAAGTNVVSAPAAIAGTSQQVTWTFTGASINPGSTMVITFVVQYGTVTTGKIYTNDVAATYTGGATPDVAGLVLAPITVPLLSSITKTVDCIYTAGVCIPGSYVDGTQIPANAQLGYKVVYSNISSVLATGVTVTDTLPTQTAANSISNLVVNGVSTAAPGSAAGGATVSLLSGSTLAGNTSGTITFAVQTTATAATAPSGVTNTAKMVTAQDPLGVTGSITEPVASANLNVSKVVTAGTPTTVAQGGTASYTISVTNSGTTSGTLTSLVDTLPVDATTGATHRFNWSATGVLTLNGATVTPTVAFVSTVPVSNQVNTWTFSSGVVIPAGQTFTLTFTAVVGSAMKNTTPGLSYYNSVTANYTGGVYGSASYVGQAPIYVPFNTLTITKTIDSVYSSGAWQPYTGTPLPPSALVRYLLTYSNLLPAAQTMYIKDALPASATAAGNLYVASGPQIRPAQTATPTVLSVNPAAAGAARGVDVAPTAISNTAVTFTSASLSAYGSAGSSGTLYMDVQTNAAVNTSISNCASISTINTDTCASATTTVVKSTVAVNVLNVAALSISKTTSTPTVVEGVNTATYTISITNTSATTATSSLKVYDFLPYSGLTANANQQFAYVNASSTYGNSGGATALPAPAIVAQTPPTIAGYNTHLNQQQVSWDFPTYALVAGGTVTITFNAAVGSAIGVATYTNSIRDEYTSTGVSLNANLDGAASVIVKAPPSLTFLKTVMVYWDPINLYAAPKFIPGAQALYTLIATNSGLGSVDNNATVIIDPVPVNTLLYVKDLGVNGFDPLVVGSGPVAFIQGVPTSSNLTYTKATDLSFSNDNAVTWGAVPVADAAGCDATVPPITHIRVNPKGLFAGNPIAPSPSFNLVFRVCVK